MSISISMDVQIILVRTEAKVDTDVQVNFR